MKLRPINTLIMLIDIGLLYQGNYIRLDYFNLVILRDLVPYCFLVRKGKQWIFWTIETEVKKFSYVLIALVIKGFTSIIILSLILYIVVQNLFP
jgi:hypothetical protein